MREAVKHFKEILAKEQQTQLIPFTYKKGFIPIEYSKDNFSLLQMSKPSVSFSFIDGGNAELAAASNVSLQLARVCSVDYASDATYELTRKDYYIIVHFTKDAFAVSTIPEKFNFTISLDDPSVQEGNALCSVGKVAGMVRRMLELELALSQTEKSDCIVLDGSLEEKFSSEKDLLDKISQNASAVIGFCKTNSIITSQGGSFGAGLFSRSHKENVEHSWLYKPVFEIHNDSYNADMVFAKLNSSARHVFRIDMHSTHYTYEDILSQLSFYCKDPVFIGYPYGLVQADTYARISNNEKEYLKNRLAVELGEDFANLDVLRKNQDAHEILDSI